jgi:hypothetical protein
MPPLVDVPVQPEFVQAVIVTVPLLIAMPPPTLAEFPKRVQSVRASVGSNSKSDLML